MSDEWTFYPCQMGDRRAWIFFDYGARDVIDRTMPTMLLKIRIAFKRPRDDGMPTNEEFPRLHALEKALQMLAIDTKSPYVGRITTDANRRFYLYTSVSEAIWDSRLGELSQSHGYEFEFALTADKEHQGYWKELFPTEDDWQVIKDMRVLEVLSKAGDNGSASRLIDHWSYFPSAGDAEKYASWAKENGYILKGIDQNSTTAFCVRLSHESTLELQEITSRTISLGRMARKIGGTYDGWESPVCNV
jgi:hypothetical protein